MYCGHGLNYKNNAGLRRVMVKFFEQVMSTLCASVVVLNEQDMPEFSKWNENSVLIPTALRPRRKANLELRIPKGGLTWIAVGKVESRKDPQEFLNIAKSILDEFPQDQFEWVGTGPLLKEFNEKTKSMRNLSFVGFVPNHELRERLFETNVFLCTSTFEVLPISILEAVEGGNILFVRNYLYSTDVTNRFESACQYEKIDDILNVRRNEETMNELFEASDREQKGLDDAYRDYLHKMREALC